MKRLFPFVVFFSFLNITKAQVSTIVSLGSNGKLLYQADAKGNTVPDFSGVGYMNSETPIPAISVVKDVYPIAGDNLQRIQSAIDSVAALPLNANGFRGAILFHSGTYNISDTIKIKASGIILRGQGRDSATGTNFVSTKTSETALIYFVGPSNYTRTSSSLKSIINPYLPYGTKKFTVATGHNFQVGGNILVRIVPNQLWINTLHMDSLTFINPGTTGITNWTPSNFDIYYQRKVMAVIGDTITIDAPMTDLIDSTYAKGEVYKYTEKRIEKCGIENMRIASYYASETDNNHGWDAVTFANSINCWATGLDVYYFGHSAVYISGSASWVTVQNCRMIDGKSTLAGGERYSFYIDGQRSLVRDCFTRNGRHDFVTGSRTAGPNVFYNCSATLQRADIGPHQRWATGILFDNINGDGFFAVQNRTNSGSGHGWAGAEIMFWNCEGQRLVLQDPQTDNTNWAVGCLNWITGLGDLGTWPLGFEESTGTQIVAIPSLFLAQLNERLGSILPLQFLELTAVKNNVGVDLDWNTSNEINNHRFVVQYSINGSNFTDIGIVATNCRIGQSCNYHFRHSNPKNGTNFYRIKQIDKDGKFSLSPVVKVFFIQNSFSLRTNIVNHAVDVYCKGSNSQQLNFYNTIGEKVLTTNINGSKQIDVSALPAGLYFIKGDLGKVLRFVKQ